MSLIVQKYGGTSLRTLESQKCVINQIKKSKKDGNKIVIVVSAMGRIGDPYATDSLLELLSNISTKINPRTKDLIMSCGEIIACSVIAHLLDANGIKSVPLTGFQAGIITNNSYNNSKILNIDTTKIKHYIEKGKVVVIAGFQGITKSGDITTLGRGGSDTAAVALGGYLKAHRVDIFTDVEGVAVIDPRIIKNPPYIEKISYSTMYKLASHGANVIHPRAVLAGEEYNIPIRVRSTFSDKPGTLISQEDISIENKVIGICLTHNIALLVVKKKYKDNINKLLESCEICRENVDSLEVYIKEDNINKDIMISKEMILKYTEGFGVISLYYNSLYKNFMKQKTETLLLDSKFDELEIFLFDDRIVAISKDSKSIEYAKKIYSLFDC
jgi:aspartate kinase